MTTETFRSDIILDALETSAHQAADAKAQALEKAAAYRSKVESRVKDSPLPSIAWAAAAGAAVVGLAALLVRQQTPTVKR